jgi:hypothetical protein
LFIPTTIVERTFSVRESAEAEASALCRQLSGRHTRGYTSRRQRLNEEAMKRAVVSVALAIVMPWQVVAQRPVEPPPERPVPQASSTGKPTQYAVTVKGLIDKRRLTLSDSEAEKLPTEMLRATELTLSGSSDMLRQLGDHNGHCDEIAGVVSVPPTRRPTVPSVDAKKLGPFSVGVGGRESIAVDRAPRALTLKVETVTHLGESCVEGH